MKYLRIAVVSAITLTSLSIVGCQQSASSSTNTEVAESEYICPMDCEDGKTYSSNVGCPVCGMDLKEVEQ